MRHEPHNIIIGNQGYNNLILRHEPQNIFFDKMNNYINRQISYGFLYYGCVG